MPVQLHEGIGILSSEGFHVPRILVEHSCCRVEELHYGLCDRIDTVLPKEAMFALRLKMLEMVIPCASGDDTFPGPG